MGGYESIAALLAQHCAWAAGLSSVASGVGGCRLSPHTPGFVTLRRGKRAIFIPPVNDLTRVSELLHACFVKSKLFTSSPAAGGLHAVSVSLTAPCLPVNDLTRVSELLHACFVQSKLFTPSPAAGGLHAVSVSLTAPFPGWHTIVSGVILQ